MSRTTIGQRWRVIALSEQGMSSRAISARLGIPKSTVCNIVNRHAVRPGDVSDRPRSGRPRKTTPREDRPLARIAMRNRFSTTMELRRPWNLGIPISYRLATVEAAQHPELSTCEKTGTDPTPSAGKPKAALFYQHLTIQLFE